MWLKRSTPQNIVIGGAAGAFPPMIGWAAVTGGLAVEPVLLFLIIFLWTPPHFWALALYRADDYARAGMPMLPVVAGDARDPAADPALHAAPGAARRRALAARLCRLALWRRRARRRRRSCWRWRCACMRERRPRPTREQAPRKQLFGFSILYLFLLFAMLLVDQARDALFGQVRA